jgi:hypothetical protein
MLYEYAVEPRAIASSWQTFRYIFEKFGFDRGRLISQFPKQWPRLVWDASMPLAPVERKRIEVALTLALSRKIIKLHRAYDPNAADWLQATLTQDALSPFHAIIAGSNPTNHQRVLLVEELDEHQQLMIAPHDCKVLREANDLAAAMKLMLQSAKFVAFVDRYYDPFNNRYQTTLRECLRLIQEANVGVTCEIHHLDSDRSPDVAAIEQSAAQLFGTVIPEGMIVTLYRWRQKDRGADFHARYLLTDRGGIRVDAGFSAEGGPQTTDMTLMDFDLSQDTIGTLRRTADVFELVDPVLQIARNGAINTFR